MNHLSLESGKFPRDSKLVQVKVFPHTQEALFQVEYMEVLNLIINFTRERFNQPGYRIYCNLENLLLKQSAKTQS